MEDNQMKQIQMKELLQKGHHKDDLYTLEELITSCEELGLFKIQQVMDGKNETGLWTFEVMDGDY